MWRFINRERELGAITELWNQSGAQLLVVYGRRRTGKTTLLTHFGQSRPIVYWTATQSSPYHLLRTFSQTLWNYEHPDDTAATDFSFNSWERALHYAGDLAQEKRLALVLDEFPYAMAADSSLPSVLQSAWDHRLKRTQLFLVLAGSHVGMMRKHFLAYRAPLYGRATGVLRVQPMDFDAACRFLPNYSTVQALTVYATVGGIPAYLERFDDSIPPLQNIRQRLLNPTGFFQIDPLYLLNDALREPRNAYAVLAAIGAGARTLTEIARATGLQRTNVPRYLGTLNDLGFVDRLVPTTPAGKRLRGIYQITDPYLRFYFRFIAPYRTELEQGEADGVLDVIARELPAFVGRNTFEELCRDWVRRRGRQNLLPFRPTDVGRYWDAQREIDMVTYNRADQVIMVGEVKFTERPVGRLILQDLVAKAAHLVPAEGDWQIHYALFSRAGFTQELWDSPAPPQPWLVSLDDVVDFG